MTVIELRDHLAFTIGSLTVLATNPAFRANIAYDPDTMALYRELVRLGTELASVAGAIVDDTAAPCIDDARGGS